MTTLAAATAGTAAGGGMETEEAPEYPPPPAYFRMFAPPTKAHDDEDEDEGDEGLGTSKREGGEAGEEYNFPLPPPAIPLRGTPVSVFGFPVAYLDEERYDPIVPPEARLYTSQEVVVHDEEEGEEEGGRERGRAVMVEMNYREELDKLRKMLAEKVIGLMEGLRTGGREGTDCNALLGEMGQAIDNMYDVLSAYRQQQTLLQMVERMESQIQEKRGAIASLRTRMHGSAAAAEEAEDTLREAWEKLVEEGGREGGKEG